MHPHHGGLDKSRKVNVYVSQGEGDSAVK